MFDQADKHLREALRIHEQPGFGASRTWALPTSDLCRRSPATSQAGRRFARQAFERGEAVDDGPGVAGALRDLPVVELIGGEPHAVGHWSNRQWRRFTSAGHRPV